MKESKDQKFRSLLYLGLIWITYIFLLIHFSDILDGVRTVGRLLTPFAVGFTIAYLINPLISAIKKIWFRIFKKSCKNAIAMIISYILVLLLVVFLFINILPQVWMSLDMIVGQIPSSIEKAYGWLETEGNLYLQNLTNNKIAIKDILDIVESNIEPALKNMGDNINKVLNFTTSIAKFVLNLIFGVLISIYMLMHKDIYKGQVIKGVFAIFNEDKAKSIIDFWHSVNNTFSRFVIARIVDSIIIGVLCWISCLILGFNNSLLIAFIVGITNVIPYFGPFLGAIPCALIVLLQSPMDMLIFIIFILILQQFDGNILGPKLLGDSLGLTSFWIIFAVVITTGIFGIVGMFIGVPLFTVIYMLIRDFINKRIISKGKSTNSADYLKKLDNDEDDLVKGE